MFAKVLSDPFSYFIVAHILLAWTTLPWFRIRSNNQLKTYLFNYVCIFIMMVPFMIIAIPNADMLFI